MVFSEPLCKVIEQYVKKGAKLYIEGALQTRKWTDKDGVEKYSTEVVLQGFNSVLTMLDGRAGGAGAGAGAGMHEDDQADYGAAPMGAGGGSGGGSSEGGRRPAPARSAVSGGGSSSRPVDKKLDDEIPF